MPSPRKVVYEWAILAVACVLPSVVTLAYYVVAPQSGASPEFVQGVYAVAKGVQFALPIVWVFAVCREPLQWTRWNPRGVGIGVAFGMAFGAAIWFGYQLLSSQTAIFVDVAERVRAKVADVGLDHPTKFVAVGVFYTLLHSLLEEYYWRWFVFGRMRFLMPLAAAISVSALAFMAHHVLLLGLFFGWASPLTWLFSLSVMTGGAFWAWLYYRSGNLYAPWFSHAFIDSALFTVGYKLTFG
ncbi:MAG: CPBP family intramembrane glutamic endopeptidase [Pirellulales bacterium]